MSGMLDSRPASANCIAVRSMAQTWGASSRSMRLELAVQAALLTNHAATSPPMTSLKRCEVSVSAADIADDVPLAPSYRARPSFASAAQRRPRRRAPEPSSRDAMRSRTLLCFLAALSCASTAALVLGPRPVRYAPTRSSCVSMAVKKGDTVVVLAGNDKGSTGKARRARPVICRRLSTPEAPTVTCAGD